jgi:predicted P-loop ATPase
MQFHGPVFVEMPEMSQLKSWEIEYAKALITTRTDKFRPPFGRSIKAFPRRSIFIGTTNEEVYLKDVTGNRRFWPVALGVVDLPRLRNEADQLWAEAVLRYQAGEQWWLTPEQEVLAAEIQESRREQDPVEESVATVLEKPLTQKQRQLFPEIEVDAEGNIDGITTKELAGLLPNFEYDKGGQTRLGNALRALKWSMRKTSKSGQTTRRYRRP